MQSRVKCKIQVAGAKEMENVNCFLHLVSPLAVKRSSPRNSMLVQTEGGAVEQDIKQCYSH